MFRVFKDITRAAVLYLHFQEEKKMKKKNLPLAQSKV